MNRQNKNIIIKLLLVIFSVGFILTNTLALNIKVNAQAPTPSMSEAEVTVRDGDAVCKASTQDPNPNMVCTATNEQTSALSGLAALIVGPMKDCAPTGNGTCKKLPDRLRNGVAGYMSNVTYTAFLNDTLIPYGPFYARMFTPPILRDNGAVYAQFADQGSNDAFKILTQSDAVSQLWILMMSIASVGFVLMLIVAGFMIMFRNKIGGQVVVTVGMAIKNAVIAFIASVFSFAFGGFFFNISKLLLFFLAKFFVSRFGNVYGSEADLVYPNSIGSITKQFILGGSNITNGMGANAIKAIVKGMLGGFGNTGGGAMGMVKGYIGSVISGVLGALALIAIGLFIFFISFKILWKLINVYLQMILQTILAPLIFMFAALPGRQNMIGDWFKKMFVYALTIPAMFLLLNFAYVLMYMDFTGGGSFEMISGGTFGSNTGTSIIDAIGVGRLIGFVILMMVPKADDWLKETFNIKESQAAKAAVAEGKQTLAQTKIPIISSFM